MTIVASLFSCQQGVHFVDLTIPTQSFTTCKSDHQKGQTSRLSRLDKRLPLCWRWMNNRIWWFMKDGGMCAVSTFKITSCGLSLNIDDCYRPIATFAIMKCFEWHNPASTSRAFANALACYVKIALNARVTEADGVCKATLCASSLTVTFPRKINTKRQ